MLNVITVKWGEKYNSSFVNRIYIMCQKNITIPFKMYCYTDDARGINKNIEIIKIPKNNRLEKWWNKLSLFKEDMFKGKCLFFDLDIVIQNNINHICDNYKKDVLTLIKYPWNDNINSSIMLWNSNEVNYIWDHFSENIDYYTFKYRGIDTFLKNENIPLNYFRDGFIYFRLYGIDKTRCGPILTEYKNETNYEFCLYYEPNYDICVFNSYGKEKNSKLGIHLNDSSYKGFEKYWKKNLS